MDFINLTSTASTLLITLYSRALMSKNNMILEDKKAEEIIDLLGDRKKLPKVCKKLQALLTIRAHLIDEYTKSFIKKHNGNCNVIQLGCGLDSRYTRINDNRVKWYDLDFFATIEIRKNYYKRSLNYKMIASNVCNFSWVDKIDDIKKPTLIIGEGLFMYLTEEENKFVLNNLAKAFKKCDLIMDVFNKISVKFSKFDPSLRSVHAHLSFGFNHYSTIEKMSPFKHVKTQYYYDCDRINDLPWLLRTRFKIRRDLNLFKKVQRIEVYKL